MSSASTRTSTCPTRCSSTPSAAVVRGIEPGTTGMGSGFLVAADARAAIIECGIVDVRASSTAGERLLAISKALDDLIGRHRPSVLAVERLYFNKNAKTAMRVSEARGIALLCGARAGLEIAEYTPQEVKSSIAGSGRADKHAIQKMLPLLVALDAPITQDNVAAAVAIALTHPQRARFADAVAAAT